MTLDNRETITEDIVYLARSDLELAMNRVNDLVHYMPKEAWTWSLKSYVYYVKGDFESAISIIDYAIGICYNNSSLHAEKAKYLLENNDFYGAVQSYSNAIEIGKKINDPYVNDLCRFERAFCYCKIGDFSSAEADLNAVDDDIPFWFDRRYTKAELLDACRDKRLD